MTNIRLTPFLRTLCTLPLALTFAFASTEYTVSGSLMDSNNDPVAGHPLILYDSTDSQIGTAESGADGSFTLQYEALSTAVAGGSPGNAEFRISPSYPEPFSPQSSLLLESPANARASVSLYDILGRRVLQRDIDIRPGINEIVIRPGMSLAPGQYILRIRSGDHAVTEKLLLARDRKGMEVPAVSVTRPSHPVDRSVFRKRGASAQAELRLHIPGDESYHEKDVAIPANGDYNTGTVVLERKKSTWQGYVTGSGTLTQSGLEQFGSGFFMDIVNLEVVSDPAEEDYQQFEGWAVTDFQHPGWELLSTEADYSRHFRVITPRRRGSVDGVLDWSSVWRDQGWDWSFYYGDSIRPVYENWTCSGGVCTEPDRNETSILGFGGIYGAVDAFIPFHVRGLPLDLIMEGDTITVSLPEAFRENTYSSGGPEMITEYNIRGELYRVSGEETDLEDLESNRVRTDEHTRKKIDHEIDDTPDNDPRTDMEIMLETSTDIEISRVPGESLSIEQVKGELMIMERNLPEGYDTSVRTPVAVTGPRGTQYTVRVEEDSTTTITVFEGEVAFSDRNTMQTVVVGAGQRSVVRPGQAPAEPGNIGPRPPVSRWWEW